MTKKLTGASWNEKLKKWRSKITYDYKTIHLGYFLTQEEAHERFKEKYEELYNKEFKQNKRIQDKRNIIFHNNDVYIRINFLFEKSVKTTMNIGKAIKEIREIRNISLEEFGEKFKELFIKNLENSNDFEKFLIKISAEALNVNKESLAYLCLEEEDISESKREFFIQTRNTIKNLIVDIEKDK